MAAIHTSFLSLPHVEPSPRRVRVLFGGQYIVDTRHANLVWQTSHYPTYYFTSKDIPEMFLAEAASSAESQTFDLVVGNHKAERAVTKYLQGKLAGLYAIKFGAADAWFEEDDQVFIHPKDPYKRIDVLHTSRHVRVEFNGHEIANTTRASFLYETGLRIRTYIPKTDCRMEWLVPSTLTTGCPYKGTANYYDIRLPDGSESKNSVWWYQTPLPECVEIKGLMAFYDEKLDVYLDGELQPR